MQLFLFPFMLFTLFVSVFDVIFEAEATQRWLDDGGTSDKETLLRLETRRRSRLSDCNEECLFA